MSNSTVSKSWSSISALLDPDFGIAPDVTFQIISTEEEGQPSEIKAHRLILGFLSPVFRKQFFGLAKDTKEVIPVQATTKKAFKTMIDFIYDKDINWEAMDLGELFDVVNMAELYILPELMEEVKKPIRNYVLTDENLIEAAAKAESFGHFEEASTALIMHCQNFLETKIRTLKDATKFASRHANTEFASLALKLLASLNIEDCSNCGNSPCKDGISVTEFETLKVGCLMKSSAEGGCWTYSIQNKPFQVTDLFEREKKLSVRWLHSSYSPRSFERYQYGLTGEAGGWMWIYSCKNV
eukprot:GFUD01038879.1.p1 GENE.GFUD01038879.1~~GFUD01038879.1.p1  ORF type:complete len:297 (+),score=55.12 GFUD01038879.1:55-945(+)